MGEREGKSITTRFLVGFQQLGMTKVIIGVMFLGCFILFSLNSSSSTTMSLSSTSVYLRGIVEPSGGSVDSIDIFATKAVAMSSIRVDDNIDRKFYGGKGDKVHLGGFTELDLAGISPSVWQTMIRYIGVKSLVDLGCGKGVSTLWFKLHGVDVQCLEGSHDAVMQTLLPISDVVEHDFTRGPWWPEKTVDAVWCIEFAEHVQRQHIPNYATIFRKSALVFVTHSWWGGYHHAEVHDDKWFILKYQAFGLIYSPELTHLIRGKAKEERDWKRPTPLEDKPYFAQHVSMSMMVFINPSVAGLDRHQHLFSEPGCYDGRKKTKNEWGGKKNYDCGEPSTSGNMDIVAAVPDDFKPLKIDSSMHEAWEKAVFGKVGPKWTKPETTYVNKAT